MYARTLSCFCFCALLLALVSCQKAYERPDLLTGSGTGGGTGTGSGTGSGSGQLLTRAEAKTTGNTTEGFVMTYDYDANNRLVSITQLYTDSSNIVHTNAYRYKRDAAGRIVRVSQNLQGGGQGGLPDSVFTDVHYPSSTSSNFDYTVSNINFGGMIYSDSTLFGYSGSVVSTEKLYSGVLPISSMALTGTVEYSYTGNNLTMMKQFGPTSIVAASVAVFEYDSKVNPFSNGIESFLPGIGKGNISKNNGIKEVYTDNSNGNTTAQATYSYQYNSNNMPVTGTMTQTVPVAKTQSLKFFYK